MSYYGFLYRGKHNLNMPQSCADCFLLQVASVSLTASQMAAMHSTPVQIIAAPGAGFFINVVWGLVKTSNRTVSFSGLNSVQLAYGSSFGFSGQGSFDGNEIGMAINTIQARNDIGVFEGGTSNFENKAINLQMLTADGSGGDGAIAFTLYYTIETTT